MPLTAPLLHSRIPGLTPLRTGKVRDVYAAGDDHLVIVATDRISAFDYVLGSGIPDKGRILTQMSLFWFERLADIVPHHLVSSDVREFPAPFRHEAEQLGGRSILVHRTDPLPVECVARGYLAGSGWKEYRSQGTICGIPLPPGLDESDRLPSPVFTPATKAESGHDENITLEEAAQRLGDAALADRLSALTLALYGRAAAHAESCGLILADTKFEFGLHTASDGARVLRLIDEALTPDSSRFWPADEYAPGGPQPSFDKQYVRDYLEAIRWPKQPPVPALPDEVVAKTREKYLEALRRLTGQDLAG